MKNERMTLTNPHIAAYLELHGIPLKYENHGGVILITAPKTDESAALLSQFHSNDPVPIVDYISALQKVKQMINSEKKAGVRGLSRGTV